MGWLYVYWRWPLILGVLVVTVKAFAYEYKSKDYTRQQKIWQGKVQKKKNTQLAD